MSLFIPQLAAIECTFDNMVGKLVRLRSADAAPTDASDPVICEPQQLSSGVTALETSLTEILALRGTS